MTEAGQMMRVVVIDDSDDVRMMLRYALGIREFELVGEADNGIDGLVLAARTQPDLIILDRDMPGSSGLEVLPEMRSRCPESLIVLYSAGSADRVREAALAAGADQIRQKMGHGVPEMIDELADLLLASGPSDGDQVQLRLGPLPAEVAQAWVSNTQLLLAALRRRPDICPPEVDTEILDVFEGFLAEWGAVAAAGGDFRWAAAARVETVVLLVEAWANIDQLGDEEMVELGCQWSGPEARPFFDDLTRAVAVALERSGLQELREELPEEWPLEGS